MLLVPCRFEEEPATPLSLINPVLEKTCCSEILIIGAEGMESAHDLDQPLFVFTKFTKHIGWSDEIRVIVGEALQTTDVSNRANGRAADLANALRDFVCHSKYLVGVVIQQQVVVAKMRTGHMPVKVLRFQIEDENIRNECVKSTRDVFNGFRIKIGGGQEW